MLESLRRRGLIDFPPIRLQLFRVTLEFLDRDVVKGQAGLDNFVAKLLVELQLAIDAPKFFAIGNLLFQEL